MFYFPNITVFAKFGTYYPKAVVISSSFWVVSYGISVGQKKSGVNNSNTPKIVDNTKNKVGIK